MLAVTLCAGLSHADELTPSRGETAKPESPSSWPAKDEFIDMDEAEKELLSVLPTIQLTSFGQVIQNSYNWTGPQDASLKCDIGFAANALVIKGEFFDDHPFIQTTTHPARPDWWKITYVADGITFRFDDPTSTSRHVEFALNFGAEGLTPRADLIESYTGRKGEFIAQAGLELEQPALTPTPPNDPYKFRAVIPYSALADQSLFKGPLRITVRLHDIDGDPATYCMLQEIVEKK